MEVPCTNYSRYSVSRVAVSMSRVTCFLDVAADADNAMKEHLDKRTRKNGAKVPYQLASLLWVLVRIRLVHMGYPTGNRCFTLSGHFSSAFMLFSSIT